MTILEVISYIVTVLTLVGTVANAFQKSWCFYLWIVTNLFWVVYNFTIQQYQQAIIYIVNTIICVIGIVKWKSKKIRK